MLLNFGNSREFRKKTWIQEICKRRNPRILGLALEVLMKVILKYNVAWNNSRNHHVFGHRAPNNHISLGSVTLHMLHHHPAFVLPPQSSKTVSAKQNVQFLCAIFKCFSFVCPRGTTKTTKHTQILLARLPSCSSSRKHQNNPEVPSTQRQNSLQDAKMHAHAVKQKETNLKGSVHNSTCCHWWWVQFQFIGRATHATISSRQPREDTRSESVCAPLKNICPRNTVTTRHVKRVRTIWWSFDGKEKGVTPSKTHEETVVSCYSTIYANQQLFVHHPEGRVSRIGPCSCSEGTFLRQKETQPSGRRRRLTRFSSLLPSVGRCKCILWEPLLDRRRKANEEVISS